MRCPACDHEDSRTEQSLLRQIDRLTQRLELYKETPTLRDQIAIASLSKCFAPTEECIPWMVARAYKIADEVLSVREIEMRK